MSCNPFIDPVQVSPGKSSGGDGTVKSVGVSVPNFLDVSNSPVTTSGTIGITAKTQATNKVLAAPDGTTGTPDFRVLTTNDIPELPQSKITNLTGDLAAKQVRKTQIPVSLIGNSRANFSAATAITLQFQLFDIDSSGNIYYVSISENLNCLSVHKYNISSDLWTDLGKIGNIGYEHSVPAICLDYNDNIMIVWVGTSSGYSNYQVFSQFYNGSSWGSVQLVSTNTTNATVKDNRGLLSLVVDSSNNFHTGFYCLLNSETYYRAVYTSYSSGSWASLTNLTATPSTTVPGNSGITTSVGIAINSNNVIACLFLDNTNSNKYTVAIYASNAWNNYQSSEAVPAFSTGYTSVNTALVIDSNNEVIFYQEVGTAGYYLAKLSSSHVFSISALNANPNTPGYYQNFYQLCLNTSDFVFSVSAQFAQNMSFCQKNIAAGSLTFNTTNQLLNKIASNTASTAGIPTTLDSSTKFIYAIKQKILSTPKAVVLNNDYTLTLIDLIGS